MVATTLLPFAGKIIYDSFIGTFNVHFGRGASADFKAQYDEIKENIGIIENLTMPPTPTSSRPTKKTATKKTSTKKTENDADKTNASEIDTKGANIPKAMAAKYAEIAEIIEKFCDEKLNDEYKELCLKALAKLCRKRPSPVISGRANTWACGIVYAIGSNNFIFDKSQPIHMKSADIVGWFGISKSTASGKVSDINRVLNLSYRNYEYLLSSHIDDNPMIWLLNVNGLFVDIRAMPRDAQVVAYEKGLIPYIPADRE